MAWSMHDAHRKHHNSSNHFDEQKQQNDVSVESECKSSLFLLL